jgi:hypothetical protein
MKKALIVLASLFALTIGAHAQDFKKVVDIVAEIETLLKTMMTKEEGQRRAEVNALKSQVDELRTMSSQTLPANASRPGEPQRETVEMLAQRIDAMQKKLGEDSDSTKILALTTQLSGLLVELRKSIDDSKVAQAAVMKPENIFSITGFVDFYYSTNFNDPDSRTNRFRNFDIAERQFTLGLAELTVQQAAAPVGFRIDVDFGTVNDLVQTGNQGTSNILQQAYLTTVLPVGNGLTVDVGKFVTHMGYEVIEAKDNANYSRSLLFAWAIPYFHVGARVSYPVLSNLTLTAHVVNGWNNIVDNNSKKSFGLTANYALSSSTSITVNVLDGNEQPDTLSFGTKGVYDILVTHQPTDNVTLGLNFDYGDERLANGLATWKGAALYGKYTISPKSAIALRAELFSDPNGYATGIAQDLHEVTATYEYKFTDQLLVRAELRHDWSNQTVFDKKSTLNAEKHQDTIVLGTIITF